MVLAGTVRAMDGAAGASMDGFTAFPAKTIHHRRLPSATQRPVMRPPYKVTLYGCHPP